MVVQRLRPTARAMLRTGVPLMLGAFVLLVVGDRLAVYLVALAILGLGLGLVRPGTSAAASLAVGLEEQGAVAGLMGGLAVVGNVIGPMIATILYEVTPRAPYLLSIAIAAAALVVVFTSPRVRALRA
jgi:MFS family permease